MFKDLFPHPDLLVCRTIFRDTVTKNVELEYRPWQMMMRDSLAVVIRRNYLTVQNPFCLPETVISYDEGIHARCEGEVKLHT